MINDLHIIDSGVISTEKQIKRNIRRQIVNKNKSQSVIDNSKIITDPQIASKYLLQINYTSILLVEPYRVKYSPLGLLKLYTFYKNLGKSKKIDLVGGKHNFGFKDYTTIFITVGEFSYYHDKLIRVIQYYLDEYPNAEIILGGVYIQGRNLDIANNFTDMGCTVLACEVPALDIPVNYELDKGNMYNFVFTTRGCTLACSFCYVKVIEPNEGIVPTWKKQITEPTPPYIMIHDNNILAFSNKHFNNVTNALIETNKPVMFDNGYDVRFWNDGFLSDTKRLVDRNLISNTSIRSAFDTTSSQDGKLQKMLLDLGKILPAEEVLVYVLINYETDIKDCLYRASEVARCGSWPFIQYYAPSSYRGEPDTYKGDVYNPEFHIMQKYYNSKAYKCIGYEKYKCENSKNILSEVENL